MGLCVPAAVVAEALPEFARWGVEQPGEHHQAFLTLPDERTQGSVSVGDVSDGFLAHAHRVVEPHPNQAFLPIQYRRQLAYTTDELAALVEAAAAATAAVHPGSVVFLGNFSARHGGDIPYSVSHNSGRDCDLAFFMVDGQGQPFVPPDLVALNEDGTWVRDDGQAFSFDTPRNWTLVKSLLANDGGALQYIFVSNGLKALLLDHARASGEPPELVAAADEILAQPGGALPHNDHFHLRVYCANDDLWAGCQDQGRVTSRRPARSVVPADAVAWAASHLESADPPVRRAALQRLGHLRARSASKQVAARLADADPLVRVEAARTLGLLDVGSAALAARLPHEDHPAVRLELIDALGRSSGKDAVVALTSVLDVPRALRVDELEIHEANLAADALARLEDARAVKALVEALGRADEGVRPRVLLALQKLTNQGIEDADGWKSWLARDGRKSRDQWLVAGFRAAGYKVDALKPKAVWELCRAIHGPEFLSFNAQRTLMRLARRDVPSLSWSQDDASFYWRRWFERRAQQFRLPPIPPDLSTLKPAQTVSRR